MITFQPGVNTFVVWNHTFLAPVVPGVIVARFRGKDFDKQVACISAVRELATTELALEFVTTPGAENLPAGKIYIPASAGSWQLDLDLYDVAAYNDPLPDSFYIDLAHYKI